MGKKEPIAPESLRHSLKLLRRGDAIFAESDQSEPVEVKLVYARPVSDRSEGISVLSRKEKEEIAWINRLSDLEEPSRSIAREALEERYPICYVESVVHSFVNHGHRYLKVETNRGFRYFNLKEPGKNVTWLSDDRLVIRDSMGNRYEISLSKLDEESRARLDKVL